MRARGVLLLLLIVLIVVAPAVVAELFTAVMTALRSGLANALTG